MDCGLTPTELHSIRNIFAQYPQIQRVLLYGSRAKGNYKPASDIDLALIGDDLHLSDLTSLAFALDDLLLPYKFDLTLYARIPNPDLREHIDRVGVDICS